MSAPPSMPRGRTRSRTAGQFLVPRLSTRRYAVGPSEGEKEGQPAPSTGQTFNQSRLMPGGVDQPTGG